MHRGYLAIWRKFFEDHPFWREKRKYSKAEAWIDILLNTHFRSEPRQRLIAGKMVKIEYGECVMSTRYCASRWGWTQSAVQRFMRTLVTLSQIRLKSTHIANHIIIVNFSKYDLHRLTGDSPATHRRLTGDSPATQTKELNRGQKDKVIDIPSGISIGKAQKPNCPSDKIVNLYHQILPALPGVPEITDPLKKLIRARWKEHPTLDWFEWYFRGVLDCPFLLGKSKRHEFTATLYWLMGPQNMAKVLSGLYLDKSRAKESEAQKAFMDGK